MLFKNALRTLGKRYLQLILLGVIVILSSLIYTIFDYSIEGLIGPAEDFFEETNQEDFSIGMFDALLEDDVAYITNNCLATFGALAPNEWPYTLSGVKKIDDVCYYGLIDNRLQEIEDTYQDIDLEVRESKTVYFTENENSYRVLYLKDMDTINTSFIVEGEKPDTSDEIAISQEFAKNNDLSIGDDFSVGDQDYTISGFVLFADYNLALFGREFIIDNTTQTFALVTDEEFENIDVLVSFEIAGVLDDGYSSGDFKKDVIQTYSDHDNLKFISSITLTENQMRSGGIYADIKSGKAMGFVMSILIASIGLMIVGIMVSRVLHSQRGAIGILKSMGYTNNEITKPYIILIAIMSLPAIIAGYFLGLVLAEPLKDMFLTMYLLPSQAIEQSFITILVAVIMPFVFIVGLSYFIVKNLLNQKPVTLLNPEVTSSENKLTKKMTRFLKNMKVTKKLQHLLLYRSSVKFVVYLVGMFMAAFLILLSFSMVGIFDRILYDYYEDTNFNYIGYCEYIGDCVIPDDGEAVIEIPNASVNENDLTLYGIQLDSEMIPLYDKKGNLISDSLEEGAVISEAAHLGKGIDVGDLVTIKVGDAEMEIEVLAISEVYTDDRIYVNIIELSQMLTDTDDYYNAVYSGSELDSEDYMAVISVDDIINQSNDMNVLMNAMVYIMIFFSIAIGAIIIYILTVMTIEDNFYNISLFKVLGYNQKEIDKMILGGYQWYGIAAFLLTIPISILSFKMLMILMAQMFNLQFPIKFVWWQGLVAIAIYLVIFNLGAIAAKKHLKQISLQEAMKLYEI